MPKIIIRIENLLIAVISCGWLYSAAVNPAIASNFYLSNWYVIILIWLSFDLSAIGYLVNKKVGSITYNLVHNYILVLLLVASGIFWGNDYLTFIGVILASHVGIDRFLGFGLKYPSDFKHTHIQKL